MTPPTLTRAKTLAQAERGVATVEYSDPDGRIYETTPRRCRCPEGPLPNPERDIVTCFRCGSVLAYPRRNGAGR